MRKTLPSKREKATWSTMDFGLLFMMKIVARFMKEGLSIRYLLITITRWIAGTRNGRGVCLYSDGTLYEGSWVDFFNFLLIPPQVGGKEHGYGVWMTGERQIIYSGDWIEGKMQGTGTYYFPNGDIYVGMDLDVCCDIS